MKSVLFYDPVCPYGYDLESLRRASLGDIEAAIIQVAEKLGEKYSVVVAQAKKRTHSSSKSVQYVPFAPFLLSMPWHAAISVRSIKAAQQIRSANASVPLWLWCHDLIDIHLFPYISRMKELDIGAIVISEFLHKQFLDLIALDPFLTQVPQIRRIYNPIADELVADQTVWDPNKLLFASIPLKGLDETLEGFKMLQKECPEFKLFVTHPEYLYLKFKPQDNVTFLGNLSRLEKIEHMRSSFALFQLNHVWPEAFGLMLAEANAVGAPVLTHPLGATVEVLENKEQLVNTYDLPSVIERILQWRAGKRPEVNIPEKFRMSHIMKEWEALLA